MKSLILTVVLGFAVQALAQFNPRPAPTPAPRPTGTYLDCTGLHSEFPSASISRDFEKGGIDLIIQYDLDIPATGGQGFKQYKTRGRVTADVVELDLLAGNTIAGKLSGMWNSSRGLYELNGYIWSRQNVKFECKPKHHQ